MEKANNIMALLELKKEKAAHKKVKKELEALKQQYEEEKKKWEQDRQELQRSKVSRFNCLLQCSMMPCGLSYISIRSVPIVLSARRARPSTRPPTSRRCTVSASYYFLFLLIGDFLLSSCFVG